MPERDLNDKDKVQAAVRRLADEYLKDPNINSVGIGYKETDGQRTDEKAFKFTVGEKFAPDVLEAVGTLPIPETLTANGITLPTDIVRRKFEQHLVSVETGTKPDRKRRLDPAMPGISVANFRETAGTIGCLVRENASGETRMLSNWHVFNGPDGQIDDQIMQPGPYDDNRGQNLCGRLVRSFLGRAGDCAIASIEGREVTEEILGLEVPVRHVGDPDLDDRVVKSGRTTGITYGVVTRVHTISRIPYGSRGDQQIGGFEIGPDAQNPAKDGEVSMPGDSGSAWMAVDDMGAASDMMLGLHFGGETGGAPEHALACYASAVFQTLEISPLEGREEGAATAVAVVASRNGNGYDAGFLPAGPVAIPLPTRDVEDDYALTTALSQVRDYMHFSLAMSGTRRFCRWVAWNVDGTGLRQLSRTGIPFVLDEAYDARYQVDNDLYAASRRLDRGHIARRADLLWGTQAEAEQANVDSFFFTNITPQLDNFNQSSRNGLWGELEDAIFDDVTVDDLRISVFGGPVFKPSDPTYMDVLLPRSFWKVIAYVEGGELKAKAFVLTQDDLEHNLESLGLEPFKLYQLPIADLSGMTSLDYGNLAGADTMSGGAEALGPPGVRRIETRADITAV